MFMKQYDYYSLPYWLDITPLYFSLTEPGLVAIKSQQPLGLQTCTHVPSRFTWVLRSGLGFSCLHSKYLFPLPSLQSLILFNGRGEDHGERVALEK